MHSTEVQGSCSPIFVLAAYTVFERAIMFHHVLFIFHSINHTENGKAECRRKEKGKTNVSIGERDTGFLKVQGQIENEHCKGESTGLTICLQSVV